MTTPGGKEQLRRFARDIMPSILQLLEVRRMRPLTNRAPRDRPRMTDTLKPRDAKDVEAAVHWALAEGKALEIVGQGTKRAIGRPAQTDLTLDLSGLTGVTLYEPEELVLSAKAGTPIAEIEALVAAKASSLRSSRWITARSSAAPPAAAPSAACSPPISSGPRRIKAGAARDHFLGVTAVSGRGETFKSGGRVVKNVTGYDLCKLIAGSWGTLAAMTEVTIKTLPRPETEATVLVLGLDAGAAVAGDGRRHGLVLRRVGRGASAGGRRARLCRTIAGAGTAVTALRLEGVAPSVAHRAGTLTHLLKPFGEVADTGTGGFAAAVAGDSRRHAVRGEPAAGDRPLWRISTAPTRGAELAAMIAASADAHVLSTGPAAWSGWRCRRSDDAGAALMRAPSARSAAMRRSSARRRRCALRSTCSSRRMRGSRH